MATSRCSSFRKVAFAAAAAIALLGAASTTVEQVGRTRAAIVLPDGKIAGSVIIIPGGTTEQTIDADGNGSNDGNFVMRIRTSFVDAGYAIAYLEQPADLRAIIARMRKVARPVFLLSTSNGTGVAAANAANLGADGPDGVVLTSTVTRTSRKFSHSAADANVEKITVPVLFIHNTNDGCSVSPASGVAQLMARFPKGADVTRIDVTSPVTGNDPCEPFSAHGYMGIEGDVTSKILAWMRAHGAQGTD
jgi:pimeloyl-ACP methyl ester carboxylesterase